MDSKTVEELRGLAEKATPGPWHYAEREGRFLFKIMSASVYVAETSWHDASPIYPTKVGSEANFALIVAMRNALPELLDLAASLAREGKDGEKPYRDAWQRIFADDSLALIRKRMSADNIMRIIRHVHAAMWRPIETLEGGENDFVLARTADGRVMQWRASLLARNLKGPTPDHLRFPAVEWMPAPLKAPKPL